MLRGAVGTFTPCTASPPLPAPGDRRSRSHRNVSASVTAASGSPATGGRGSSTGAQLPSDVQAKRSVEGEVRLRCGPVARHGDAVGPAVPGLALVLGDGDSDGDGDGDGGDDVTGEGLTVGVELALGDGEADGAWR